MNVGRPSVTVVELLMALAGSVFAPGAAEPPPPTPRSLAPDVWLIPGGFLPNRQPDGNSIVFKAPKGLVVLDTGRHRWHRQAILDLAKAQGSPIVAIVNSHWHLDHVSGNPHLKAAYPTARVYASDAISDALSGFLKESARGARAYLATPGIAPETAEDIRGDLATTEAGDALRPDVIINESGTLSIGGRAMEVNLARNAPTAGDVWLYDRESRIAAVGDLVTLPVPFLDTACVAGWKSALARVWATPFEMLVPGHGKPMTRAEFGRYRAAFDAFMNCSNSNRPVSECAGAWVKDAGSLIEASGMDLERAESMAGYYVSGVLRPNGGNSKFCKVRPQ